MKRTIDWRCGCGWEIPNAFEDEQATARCPQCGERMEQVWWKRSCQPAQWSDRDAVMVHINPKTGEVMYPADHSARLRDGYERVYLRSLPEVNKFERERGVANERMHFDRNGRGLDDYYRDQKMVH